MSDDDMDLAGDLAADLEGDLAEDLADLEEGDDDDVQDNTNLEADMKEVMEVSSKIEQALDPDEEQDGAKLGGSLSSEEYELVIRVNRLVNRLGSQMRKLHQLIKDIFNYRFPELAGLVKEPAMFAHCARIIANNTDVTDVNDSLEKMLPPHTVMVINVTFSATEGKVLEQEQLDEMERLCTEMDNLEMARALMLEYLTSRVQRVAPNLGALVGNAIAAQLIGAAGGLEELAAMPSNVLQLVGKQRKTELGLSAGANTIHAGFLVESDLVRGQAAEISIQKKAVRVLASKASLAAKIDFNATGAKNGTKGAEMRSALIEKIEKWKAPPPGKREKPLPAPIETKRTKRAGKKARAAKAKWKMTEMRKMTNRITFAGTMDGDDIDGQGPAQGMLGKVGSSILRLAAETKVQSRRAKEKTAAAAKPKAITINNMDF